MPLTKNKGGRRNNSGRKPAITPDGLPRKMNTTNASPQEWSLILEFARIVKSDYVRAEKILREGNSRTLIVETSPEILE